MKSFSLILLVLAITACQETKTTQLSDLAAAELIHPIGPMPLEMHTKPQFVTDLYEAHLSIETQNDGSYQLVIAMSLKNDSYFVSPNAKRDFSGKFSLHWESEKPITLINGLDEQPLSVEELDPHPFIQGNVNWVRQNTTYKQRFKKTSDDDFEILGHIQFTIEPKCTLERLPFIIKYKQGNIYVERFEC